MKIIDKYDSDTALNCVDLKLLLSSRLLLMVRAIADGVLDEGQNKVLHLVPMDAVAAVLS
jgi:hypothetical protein